jgi:hypothetical protein
VFERGELAAAAEALEGFTAAPFTPDEAARRAQQLLRFLALVPVEYDRGVEDTRVTLDFEIQEAVAFRAGAAAAFAICATSSPSATPRAPRRRRPPWTGSAGSWASPPSDTTACPRRRRSRPRRSGSRAR